MASLGKPNQFHEQPFPRLPIVLPTAVRRVNDLVKPSPQHFKLYFLCEHEAHTAKGRLKETDRVHLTDHAGYDISQPMELFKKFGTYILAVMRAVRADIPSMIVAPLASSTVLQELSRIEDYTQESISSLFDMTIGYLEGMDTGRKDARLQGITNPFVLDSDECLYGHPLSLYVDYADQTFGNLHRSVTKDGDVHWVCRAHFQHNDDDESTRRFREVVEENQGLLQDETGTVDIKLDNESKAIAFFENLGGMKSVQELTISFNWDASQNTLQSLANAILKSNVVSIEFHDNGYASLPTNDLDSQRRYDPFIQLFANGRIQVVRLQLSHDFFQHVSSLSAYKSFPTIRKLSTLQVSTDCSSVYSLRWSRSALLCRGL
ncbi:hypothetical protein BGZ68_001340 [Mortierella alpina]|nr:hypothetical protein BGZ68_001340 [Mortierella alpina]